jgi:hypothetical protein
MNNPTSIREPARRRGAATGKGGAMVRRVRGKVVCMLALVLLSLAATATLSPDPTANGQSTDMAQVTSNARFKTH